MDRYKKKMSSIKTQRRSVVLIDDLFYGTDHGLAKHRSYFKLDSLTNGESGADRTLDALSLGELELNSIRVFHIFYFSCCPCFSFLLLVLRCIFIFQINLSSEGGGILNYELFGKNLMKNASLSTGQWIQD